MATFYLALSSGTCISKIMNFKHWLEAQGIRPGKAAKDLGRSRSTIKRLVDGERTPSAEIMDQVYKYTKGAVSANDWLAQNPIKASPH